MFRLDDENSRYKLILERRKGVAPGDLTPPNPGDIFTHSFNLSTGDRSYMQCLWKALHVTQQHVYAECVLNAEKDEPGPGVGLFEYVGRRHMFDRGEYQFYQARTLYDVIVGERAKCVQGAEAVRSEPVAVGPNIAA